ncbi:MAG: arylsulfatase, partial [bacterium]
MKRTAQLSFVSTLILVIISACKPASDTKTGERSPNILFILTDDLGYGDIGVLFQNQREGEGKPSHKTPNLDNMANEGMLLKQHYVPAPVCAPSRASLLRGVHQGNAEIRNNQFDKDLPANHTIASVLKEAGYTTAIIGKYGLQGREGNNPESWKAYPTKRGFDHFFGYVRHRDGHNHYPAHKAPERDPVELYSGDQEISDQLRGCYTTDLFTAEAKRWIKQQNENNPDQPFFMYLAYDTPHAGLQVAATPYPEGGGIDGGVQFIGESGNYINTATEEIDDYIHPDYADQDWPDVHKRHASMVRRIDNGVGDIFQLLKDLGIDENTLVVFASDNGPHSESYGYGEYAPVLFESFGEFDGIKRDTWEGGIRTPLIIRWPGKIPSGSENATPSGFHDWLPTFAELAGVPAPANTDGVSLIPLLRTEKDSIFSRIYVEYSVYGETPSYAEFHESHKGMKRGEMQVIHLEGYKGIRYNILSHDDDFRIYDVNKDPGEINDLAGKSEFFTELQKKMKNTVLRVRSLNPTAPRPYDSIPVPAIDQGKIKAKGLKYNMYEVTAPWTPDIKTLAIEPTKSGISEIIDPAKGG